MVMVPFGEYDVRWQVRQFDFEILFCLIYGNQNVEYKSWINVQENWHLKEEIVRVVLECNAMEENWLNFFFLMQLNKT